jgi:Carboxypeptidase regulatory-like domain/TonB dependent receptor/TonB-dependent Receptor Plug Domain
MIARTIVIVLLLCVATVGQTPTTGRIAGTVKDPNGAVIVRAEVAVSRKAKGDERKVTTDDEGNYAVPLLPPGAYRVTVKAHGFAITVYDPVQVVITETTRIDSNLILAGPDTVSVRIDPLLQADGPQLGRVVDSRAVSELPLATRNFTQLLGLSPGTSVELPDNTAVGRNSQNVSVNGARTNQNNYQINGVDANNIVSNNAVRLAVPAPETIQEFKVQTSLYDATFGRAGGGNVQAITRNGANDFHGAAYEYFRNDGLNANNPFLKAVGAKRPVLKRNVFGGLLGGPFKKDNAFFFVSYQAVRERNGASSNSLSSSVLIDPSLTNDRSEATLLQRFKLSSIHPVALTLLNTKLSNGQFLIPTPQANGRYSGSAVSSYSEDQFNANLDYRVNERNWFAVKFFFSNAPQMPALFAGPNVPGFGADQANNNRLISVQDIHAFSATVINEARIGYNFIRQVSFPQEPVKDSDLRINRSNAGTFPGLPLIRIAPNSGGIVFGTAAANSDQQLAAPSTTLADVLSITRGKHSIRAGAEFIYYQLNLAFNQNTRGQIDFSSFSDFLTGTINASVFGSGIDYRSLRATDYNLFVQDDWKFSRKLTLNLGLRYELDLPAYDTRGRITTFDPALYQPRLLVVGGVPRGPPAGGFVQAGNVIPQYDLPDVPNVGKRVVTSNDPNNFAPRIGFAYSPLDSGCLVVRGGYGIFYSRASFTHLGNAITLPPNYIIVRRTDKPPFADPFFPVPSIDKFPTLVPGIDLADQVFDRNLRTPYFHQYIMSAQYALSANSLIEIAYVGGRGINLFRNVGINQARLASPQQPIINDVLRALGLPGDVITTNTPGNAQLRAPFQGVSINSFGQRQTAGQSNYNSLQISLTRRLSKGLQLLGSYTYAKSIDNASSGAFNTGQSADSGFILGDQLDNRANRGVSDFDRTHRFVLSCLWDLPQPAFKSRSLARRLFSNWQVAGIITAMSGLPIDIVDTGAGSFYGLSGGGNALARPNWSPGATRNTATSNIPTGYFFNPFAFARPIVVAGQLIPSSNGMARTDALGTDIGNVGRNVLRGPKQTNVDFSIIKRFPIRESKNIEFRAEFFNLFNHVNFANPISNFNAFASSNGSIDLNSGQIINPGDFGRITSTSNNPRLIQLALKFNF